MLHKLLDHFVTKIKLSKTLQATYHLVTVVAYYALLSSLFYLPRCMQARAEGFVQNARLLEEEYRAFWTSKSKTENKRYQDLAETQVEWLNDDPVQQMSLRRLAAGWRRHVEYCQSRWTKALGCCIPIGIAMIQVAITAPGKNQVLVFLLLARGATAALHLVAFHVIVYPRVKELDFLMNSLSGIKSLTSPLWLSLSLPLASILWSVIFALALAVGFACNPLTVSSDSQHFDSTTSTILMCIIPDMLPIAWLYYQFKYLSQ